jgi:hypothetical protein
MSYLYFDLQDRTTIVNKMRIWRYDGDISKVPEIDKKYVDYTSVKVDATILNIKDD